MHPPRVGRAPGFSYLGTHRYFLTICTARRVRAFVSSAIVDPIRSQFLQSAADWSFAVIAYCFMPDHVHLLIEGTSEAADLVRFVNRGKQATGFWFKQQHGTPLWQVGYYDRIVRDEEATLSIARYVIENPLRAGLVTTAKAYPYVGCPVHGLDAVLEAIQIDWRPRRKA